MKHAKQRGVALLVAVVIFAIATTVAAAITYNKAMAARRAAATFTLEQALQAGMAAEALAAIALEEDGQNNKKTQLDKDWARPLGPVEIEGTGIWIQAQLEDLTSKFNLNRLVVLDPQSGIYMPDAPEIQVFRELLQQLNIDTKYADLMTDWIDNDTNPQSGGGEDTLFLSQAPPYRPPNTFIMHPSEILALPNFGAANYELIAPYITALPRDALINPCTASGLLVDALSNNQQTTWATAPVPTNQGCKYPEQNVLAAIADPKLKQAADNRMEEKSSWFRLRSHIRIGTAEFVLYSVIFRESNSNRSRVVQRSFGSD
jgi:general secretion pathway protein K